MIEGHGDDLHLLNAVIRANFSSNVYNEIDNRALIEQLRKELPLIASYPEPDAGTLAASLAELLGIGADELCISNGATEAIYLIAQAYRDSYSQVLAPTFSEYADACQIHGHRVEHIGSLEQIKPEAQLLWLCNPNNPTGCVLAKQEFIALLKTYPQKLFVADQSYEYFTAQELLSSSEALQYPNLILIHSMTKRFAIPGLRLGYLTATAQLVTRLHAQRMPWSVNALAIKAGEYLVGKRLPETINRVWLWQEAERLAQAIAAIEGFEPLPSDTHFMLIRMNRGKAAELKQYLIEQHGLLIRDASNFVGLDSSYFRIATQTKSENDLLITALQAWAAERKPR